MQTLDPMGQYSPEAQQLSPLPLLTDFLLCLLPVSVGNTCFGMCLWGTTNSVESQEIQYNPFFLSCGHANQEAFDVNNTRIWREVSLWESTICPPVGERGLLCLLWEKLVEPWPCDTFRKALMCRYPLSNYCFFFSLCVVQRTDAKLHLLKGHI